MIGGHGSRPPRLARWLIERIAPPGLSRDGLLGDLDELWLDRPAGSGRYASDLWYWWEAIRAASGSALESVRRRGVPRISGGSSRGANLADSALTDVRFAIRTLRRSAGFAGTAILILALGIGGATAIFTVVDGVLLRPPPYSEPGRLVNVWTTYPHWRIDRLDPAAVLRAE